MLEAALTVRQVADALQVKQDVVLRMIRDGELIASNINPGGQRPRWRVMESDFARFIIKTRHAMELPKIRRPKAIIPDYFQEGVIEKAVGGGSAC